MGAQAVDQLLNTGVVVQDVDRRLSENEKNELLLRALPGAQVVRYGTERVVCFQDEILLKKQVTHLGKPWPGFKKRIQIPNSWVAVVEKAQNDGFNAHFIGIYSYRNTVVFVDFDPTSYVQRKANNSAAHVSTNDLFKALTDGIFARTDQNGNQLVSIRSDKFSSYLRRKTNQTVDPRLEIFSLFNEEFLRGGPLNWMDAVWSMYRDRWPDRFQGEWPGFFLEYSLNKFLVQRDSQKLIRFQKSKIRGSFDYDLVIREPGSETEYFGDLKASDAQRRETPGNDSKSLHDCIARHGLFWYVIYEHQTLHSRDNGDLATIAWNRWRQSVGYKARNGFDELSYRGRFKESVSFSGMKILEVNSANLPLVMRDFAQGRQQDGSSRALKVMIDKNNIDNYLVYAEDMHGRHA